MICSSARIAADARPSVTAQTDEKRRSMHPEIQRGSRRPGAGSFSVPQCRCLPPSRDDRREDPLRCFCPAAAKRAVELDDRSEFPLLESDEPQLAVEQASLRI